MDINVTKTDANPEHTPHCARCPHSDRYCSVDKGKAPANCPTLRFRELEQAVRCDGTDDEFIAKAAIQEGSAMRNTDHGPLMPVKPRIVEIVEFARRMGYAKIGLVFCGGSMSEAGIVSTILETNGFEVISVMCKVGKTPKSHYGITRDQQVDARRQDETMCNPVLQAGIANEAGTDFNILLNLCVGHDSLAVKYLDAPTTVLSVKDRLTGHNPLAPIYMYNTYYRYLHKPLP